MSHGYHRNLEAVYKWFYDELSFRFPTSVREVFHNKQNEWKFYTGRFENLQKNSCDCEVFTIAWAIALVKGLHLKQVDQRSITTTRMNLLSLITCHTGTQGVIKEPTYLSIDTETREAENIILQATYLEEQVRIAVDQVKAREMREGTNLGTQMDDAANNVNTDSQAELKPPPKGNPTKKGSTKVQKIATEKKELTKGTKKKRKEDTVDGTEYPRNQGQRNSKR
jgi:hypothetical protein